MIGSLLTLTSKPTSSKGTDDSLAFAEGQRFLRTDIDAGWWQTVLQPGVVTEDALLNNRIEGTGITVTRDTERTGNHAVTAADTDFVVVDHSTFCGLGVGIDETGA
jgi:uncharacterized membrane protein